MSDGSSADPVSRTSIEARLNAVGLPPLDRLAWLEIDTAALEHNVRVVRDGVAADTAVWPVVKDDAYGHGIEVATRAFTTAGAAGVCVATLGEAQAIRAADIATPVLILYPVPEPALPDAIRDRFAITVSTDEAARSVARAWAGSEAVRRGERLAVHVEVETGFTRMGVRPERLRAALAELDRPGIEVVAVWSHLATPEDARASDAQEARLVAAAQVLGGATADATHLAASGGLLTGRGLGSTLTRPGLVSYGVLPDGPVGQRAAGRWLRDAIRPALRLVARPIRIEAVPTGTAVGYGGTWVAARPSRIATLPVGYGDGYARANRGGEVLVRGLRVPVVGVVSMDACTVDVTDLPDVGLADEFVLLGTQADDAIGAGALAQRRTTIAWEVLTGMARRLTRVYDAPAGLMGVRSLAGETLVR